MNPEVNLVDPMTNHLFKNRSPAWFPFDFSIQRNQQLRRFFLWVFFFISRLSAEKG
jgi:hypothetical protein